MSRYEGLQALKVEVEKRVAWVTIDHPPINLFDVTLFLDLGASCLCWRRIPTCRSSCSAAPIPSSSSRTPT